MRAEAEASAANTPQQAAPTERVPRQHVDTREAAAPSPDTDSDAMSDASADANWAVDLLHMLQQIDERLARLETKISAVDRQQSDTRSQGLADRQELELHRGALARLQRLLRTIDGRQRDD